MKVVFVVRVHKLNGSRLAFYVPKSVIEFYEITGDEYILETSSIRWREDKTFREEKLPDLGTKLYPHSDENIRGMIPRWPNMPDPGTLVELTLELA